MDPKISIIIPCYNSESTLEETLESVIKQNFSEWEAIIVNDGSQDNLEEVAFAWVAKDARFKYFKKENGGLGAARNHGIKKASGNYILPLDSDNKIRPHFATNAFRLFESNPNIGVIYGNAEYFGERTGVWRTGDFDRFRLLKHNYIDACAVIRKEVFDKIGMYDIEIPYQGHEDWEFWMRVMVSDYDFFYFDEITFDYRVCSTSMIKSFDSTMLKTNFNYIRNKHSQQYFEAYDELFMEHKKLKKQKKPFILAKFLKNKLDGL